MAAAHAICGKSGNDAALVAAEWRHTEHSADYTRALDNAEKILGFSCAPFVDPRPAEPANAYDFTGMPPSMLQRCVASANTSTLNSRPHLGHHHGEPRRP